MQTVLAKLLPEAKVPTENCKHLIHGLIHGELIRNPLHETLPMAQGWLIVAKLLSCGSTHICFEVSSLLRSSLGCLHFRTHDLALQCVKTME